MFVPLAVQFALEGAVVHVSSQHQLIGGTQGLSEMLSKFLRRTPIILIFHTFFFLFYAVLNWSAGLFENSFHVR